MRKKDIKKIVKESYAKIAKKECDSSCCNASIQKSITKKIGYSDEEIALVPQDANLGLGCGNPVALASLKEGETVLDLGCGAGFDCFLAAKKVGKSGKVIGVDMTLDMIKKARLNSKKGNYTNIEFKLGEIENLPIEDNSIDVIISNCVINLSVNKEKVFKEAYRVLKRNGRLMIADIVLLKKLPKFIKDSVEAYVGCISGAILKNSYIKAIKKASFTNIKIINESYISIDCMLNDKTAQALLNNFKLSYDEIKNALRETVASIIVHAEKK